MTGEKNSEWTEADEYEEAADDKYEEPEARTTPDPLTIKIARFTMKNAFKKDPDFKRGYIDNVAMLLHDRYGITNYEKRNKAAEEIIDLIFGE